MYKGGKSCGYYGNRLHEPILGMIRLLRFILVLACLSRAATSRQRLKAHVAHLASYATRPSGGPAAASENGISQTSQRHQLERRITSEESKSWLRLSLYTGQKGTYASTEFSLKLGEQAKAEKKKSDTQTMDGWARRRQTD